MMTTNLRGVALIWTAVVASACGGASSHGDGGGAGDGSATVMPLVCTAGGLATKPTEVTGGVVSLGQVRGDFVALGSDLSGSLTTRSAVRIQVVPAKMMDPPSAELRVYVNGCAVGQLKDLGEEYYWTTQAADAALSVEAGKYVVVEVVRAGAGVVLRKAFAAPAVMPRLTAPAAHMAITAPVKLQWMAIGLKSIAGVMTSDLSVTAWISMGGGSGQTDGFMMLSDMAGQASWNAGKGQWTSIQLQAHMTFSTVNEEMSYSFYLPVN